MWKMRVYFMTLFLSFLLLLSLGVVFRFSCIVSVFAQSKVSVLRASKTPLL